MPRISAEEALARREQIVDACERLYQQASYSEITMAHIAKGLSFGRANVYNYFQNKEEIFLALLEREHLLWQQALTQLAQVEEALDDDRLAQGLARSLADRPQLLKLMSMNLYDMEENSRRERLVSFKASYAAAIDALRTAVVRHKRWDRVRADRFVYAFLPFMYGVYPYAFPTAKQADAMREVGLEPLGASIYELSYPTILALLAD